MNPLIDIQNLGHQFGQKVLYEKLNIDQGQIFREVSHSLTPNTKRKIALLHEGFKAYDFLCIAQCEAFFSAFYPQWKREYFYDSVDLLGCSSNQHGHLNPIECDLKRNIWVLLENTNDMRHYT